LALRHQERLSYKEIADIAQIRPGTVMSRLARARAKLKECLAAHIGKDELRRSYKTNGWLLGRRIGSDYQPDNRTTLAGLPQL